VINIEILIKATCIIRNENDANKIRDKIEEVFNNYDVISKSVKKTTIHYNPKQNERN